ncbi:MAG: hypothetical protein J1F64_01410 [Oscillospiraceae bacterium]|nr:hypothetical protein [Oscillospiraceae bacterium]
MRNKKVLAVYIILRVFVTLVMVAQFIHGNYANVFLCILTLVLFFIPSFAEKKLNISLPGPLEIIILLFIVASEILGEVGEYYINVPHWDTMLHTMNGFLMGAIGFSMIDILNQNDKFHFKTTPLFVAVVAFCFSMTTGVLWEFFEFGMDVFFATDMQKDTILPVISSVKINPDGVNRAVKAVVDSTVINGGEYSFDGYLDIGLFDTMKDLIVNFIGAVVFSIVGGIYITGRGSWAKKFIPTIKDKE